MITIKTNPYNEEELEVLSFVTQRALEDFYYAFCKKEHHCQMCTYRHLCYDLMKIRDYSNKIVGGETK